MTLEVTDIMEILPHRYPMLLIDRIIELEPMKYAIGIKNATFNEQFFQGHFPGKPVMPGVLIAEAMAQVGGIALAVDPATVEGFAEDADNYLILVRVTPGQSFTYYMGSAWDRGLDFATRSAWEDFVANQRFDFRQGN